MSVNDYDYLFKILILGDAGIGKTSFLTRYAEDVFTTTFIRTIGIDFRIAREEIGGNRLKLQVWDTAGQERFRTITKAYYRGAKGFVVAYDVTCRDSFDSANNFWLNEIDRNTQGTVVAKILVGCKCDLASERAVSQEEGQALADSLGIQFIETSSKLGLNVNDAIRILAAEVVEVVNPAKVVLTLLCVTPPEAQGNLVMLSLANLGGDAFEVIIDTDNASVEYALAKLEQEHGIRGVQLVNQDGSVLSPSDVLFSYEKVAAGRMCAVQ